MGSVLGFRDCMDTPMEYPESPPPSSDHDKVRAVQWQGDHLRLLDQRKLPFDETWIDCCSASEVAQAIRDLVVRGAPAIGIAAAWGVVLAAQAVEAADGAQAGPKLEPALQRLNAARPTAVNLAWALARMRRALRSEEHTSELQSP